MKNGASILIIQENEDLEMDNKKFQRTNKFKYLDVKIMDRWPKIIPKWTPLGKRRS